MTHSWRCALLPLWSGAGVFDARNKMCRYVRWHREGYKCSTGRCLDIENTVRSVLARFEQTGEPYSSATDANSGGNGSLMRLAPVPKGTCIEESVLLAVNLGDDADTTGGIFGQIAGAHLGFDLIPPAWRARLAKADLT